MSTIRIKQADKFNNLCRIAQNRKQFFDFRVKNGIFYFTANTHFLKEMGYLSYI